ncbi:ORF28 [Ostreid herpesvirus 1]|nr:ORF28 [Ostreid herpesvirus 1]
MAEIETRGPEVFSRMPKGGIGAEKLQRLLRGKHGSTGKVPIYLIHPTVNSLLSLDLISHPAKWSPNAQGLDLHLTSMKKHFTAYCLADVLEILKPLTKDFQSSKFNVMEVLYFEEKEDLTKFIEMTFVEEINKAKANVGFDDRIDIIGNMFITAIKYHLALGFTPTIPTEDFYVEMSWKPDPSFNQIEKVMDYYCWMFERAFDRLGLMTMDEIVHDLMITDKNGVRSVSTITTKRDVVPLDFTKTFNFLGTLFIGNVSQLALIIPDEIKLIFAEKESKNLLLERLSKNIVVVSTELTKEASNAITNIMRNDVRTDEDFKEAAKKREESEKRMNKMLENRLKVALNDTSENSDPFDVDKFGKNMLKNVEAELKMSTNIQNLLASNNVTATKTAIDLDDVHNLAIKSTEYVDTMTGHMPSGSYIPGSKKGIQNEKERKQIQKTLQGQKLNENLDIVVKMLKSKITENELATNKITEMMITHEGQVKMIDELKRNIKLLIEKMTLIEKEVKKEKKENEKLLKDMKISSELIANVSQQLHLSEEDRKRLIDLSASMKDCGEDPLPIQQKLDKATTSLVQLFGSYNTKNGDTIAKRNAELKRTRMAYDQVLSAECVRPISTFIGVRTMQEMQRSNVWMIEKWMGDREVNDAIYAKEKTMVTGEEINYTSGETDENIIQENAEISFIDLNPITKERARTMKTFFNRTEVTEPDKIFDRHYMTIQFKLKGDIDLVMGKPLSQKWDMFYNTNFRLKRDIYTKVGNKLQPKLTEESLILYGKEFFRIMGGEIEGMDRSKIERVMNIVTSIEDVVDVSKMGVSETMIMEMFKIPIFMTVNKLYSALRRRTGIADIASSNILKK